VILVLLGEAVLIGSVGVLAWFVIFTVGNLVYIPLSEEPGLRKRFGRDYDLYSQNVPRWIPRRTPWELPKAV
jgi:protein-S-isoprenylcysteine O-methyltransferase Ste14